jgi:transketolase
MRSAEQIKVDVAYSRSKVLLLGISGGMSYGALGMSHHSLQDIAAMSAIPGIDVILPADRFETDSIIRDIMMNPRPAYVRIGRNPVPDVFESREKTGYVPGKATVVHDGNDAAIISCGELVYAAKKAADLLDKEGVHVKVIDMHTIKPTDEKVICEAADTGFILTMEEHSTYGGLGSLAARIVSEYKPVQVKVLAIPDEPVVSGKSEEVYSYYGLNAENAAAIIRNNLKSRIG